MSSADKNQVLPQETITPFFEKNRTYANPFLTGSAIRKPRPVGGEFHIAAVYGENAFHGNRIRKMNLCVNVIVAGVKPK